MESLRKLFSRDWHFNIFYALLLLGVGTLPFTHYLMLPIAIAIVLNLMVEWNWRGWYRNLRANRRGLAFIALSAICLIAIYGFTISCNKRYATTYFESQLWFLVAPLAMMGYRRERFTKAHVRTALGLFAVATTARLLTLFVIASCRYLQTGEVRYFFYGSFSRWTHPTYLSFYATTTIVMLLYHLRNRKSEMSTGLRCAEIISVVMLVAGIFCLSSKAAILILLLMVIPWFLYLIWRTKRRLVATGILLVVGAGTIIGLWQSDSYTCQRFRNSAEHLSRHSSNPNGHNSTQIRLNIWESAWTIAKKNFPMGVGTGDTRDELSLHAVRNSYTNIYGHRFNAHNQFLQNLLAAGLVGIVLLAGYCLVPIVCGIRRRDILYLSFGVILILNLCFESMFEVRAGIQFVAIMNVLLYLSSEQ